MSSIPPELKAFLDSGRGRLLIKGGPGVGKTCLSLEILNILREERKGIYITTRLQAESLLRAHPHLALSVKPVPAEDISRLSEELEEGKPILFPMVRLSRVRRSLGYLISLLEAIENPIVVFDSWQAFIDQFPPKLRHELLLETSNWAEQSRNIVIYVSESIREGKLDYIADGVVHLYHKSIEGRRIRLLEIKKLRGIPVRRCRYLFTLQGGRFTVLKDWEFKVVKKKDRRGTLFKKDLSQETVSTGIGELDKAIGGWKKGSINILEISRGVGEGYLSLVMPLAQANLNYGRGFLVIPSMGRSGYRIVENFLEGHVNKDKWGMFRFVQGSRTPGAREKDFVTYIDVSNPDEVAKQVLNVARKLSERSRDGVIICLIGMDTLELYIGAEKTLELLNNLAVYARSTGAIVFLLYKQGQEVSKMVLHLADKHLKLIRINDVVLFYGVIPYTPVYSIYTETSRGYPQSRVKMVI